MRLTRARHSSCFVTESKEHGELLPGAARKWKPVDFARPAVVGKHDGLDPGEGPKTLGAVVAAISTQPVSSESGVRICNDADDIVDGTTARGDSSSQATGARATASPDAAAEREGALIGQC